MSERARTELAACLAHPRVAAVDVDIRPPGRAASPPSGPASSRPPSPARAHPPTSRHSSVRSRFSTCNGHHASAATACALRASREHPARGSRLFTSARLAAPVHAGARVLVRNVSLLTGVTICEDPLAHNVNVHPSAPITEEKLVVGHISRPLRLSSRAFDSKGCRERAPPPLKTWPITDSFVYRSRVQHGSRLVDASRSRFFSESPWGF